MRRFTFTAILIKSKICPLMTEAIQGQTLGDDSEPFVELPDNVHLLKKGGREIYLVGTAHVSSKSADLVEQVLRGLKPDTVAVELCEPRYRALRNPDEWKKMDIVQVVKSGKTLFLLAQLMLASFQKKVGKKLGVRPGAEMLRAIEIADELGATTVLADREVSITLRRTWASLGFWGGMKLLWALLIESFSPGEELGEEEIERLKTADVLEEAMRDFAQALPQVRESLIDERDKYLAQKIASAPGQKVVAIVGAGHVPGISRYLYDDIDIRPLETIPPPSRMGKVLPWLIPVAIVLMIAYGFWNAGGDVGKSLVFNFVLITGCAGALGGLLALAHPLTILAAIIAAPTKVFHPMIGSGPLAALVEAYFRKPTVEDIEELQEEPLSIRLFWKNRVARVLLVHLSVSLTVFLSYCLSGYLIATKAL